MWFIGGEEVRFIGGELNDPQGGMLYTSLLHTLLEDSEET